MPVLLTQRFGPLEYQDSAIIEFPCGLPGFDAYRRFVLVEREPQAPLIFLQSVITADLCFLALPVSVVDPDYELFLTPEDRQVLALDSAEEKLCLTLLSAAGNCLTANLLAPVVVNSRTRIAVQAVRADFRYSHRHPLGEVATCS